MKREISNILCWIRIVLSLIVAFAPHNIWCNIVFSFAWCTDTVDGYFFRKFSQNNPPQHWFNKLPITLDPIADFTFMACGVFCVFRTKPLIMLLIVALFAIVGIVFGVVYQREADIDRKEKIGIAYKLVGFAGMVFANFAVWISTMGLKRGIIGIIITLIVFYFCLFSARYYEKCRNNIISVAMTKTSKTACVIVPGLLPPHFTEFVRFFHKYNKDYDYFVIENSTNWSPERTGETIRNIAVEWGRQYDELIFIGISIGCHVAPPIINGIKVRTIYLNPCCRDAIQVGPKWLRVILGILFWILCFILGPLGTITFINKDDNRFSLGFILLQLADCFLSNELDFKNVEAVILSSRDEFFKDKGNEFLRQKYQSNNVNVIEVEAKHADIFARYNNGYIPALKELDII